MSILRGIDDIPCCNEVGSDSGTSLTGSNVGALTTTAVSYVSFVRTGVYWDWYTAIYRDTCGKKDDWRG